MLEKSSKAIVEIINGDSNRDVIIDLNGEIESVYEKSNDYLVFSPSKTKSVQWNIFNDIDTKEDIDLIANILTSDDTVKQNIASTIEILTSVEKPTNKMLYDALASVNGMTDQLSSLEAIKDMDGDFSFKDYAINDTKSIFMQLSNDSYQTLMPIYAIAIDFISKTILSSVDVNNSKRVAKPVNLFIDNALETVHFSYIKNVFTRGRSKGIFVLLALQNLSNVEKIYGKEEADKMIENINTKFIFKN